MTRHRGCVTDPLTRRWWLDYLKLVAEASISGVSFTEYVAARSFAEQGGPASRGPAMPAGCGHWHEWGASCSRLTI